MGRLMHVRHHLPDGQERLYRKNRDQEKQGYCETIFERGC